MENEQTNNSLNEPLKEEAVKTTDSSSVTLQSILDCRTGSSTIIKKVMSGENFDSDKLDAVSGFQKSCFQKINIIKNKLAEQPLSKPNKNLLEAINKTEQRITLEYKMVNLLKTKDPGIKLGEESLSFIYANKMILPMEYAAWEEYKTSLEEEKSSNISSNYSTDYFGWGLLIIMGFVIIKALLRKRKSNPQPKEEFNEKPPV